MNALIMNALIIDELLVTIRRAQCRKHILASTCVHRVPVCGCERIGSFYIYVAKTTTITAVFNLSSYDVARDLIDRRIMFCF